MRIVVVMAVVLCGSLLSVETKVQAPYSVTDPNADHFGEAVQFDEKGNLPLAILSFRACVEFTPSSESW